MNDWSPRGEALSYRRNQRRRVFHTRIKLSQCIVAAVFAVVSAGCASVSARAQSEPTATRIGDLQVGGGFVFARSDYNFTPIHLIGGAAYTTFDKRNHWGGEFNFHQNRSTADSTVYERTYEIGPRVFFKRGPFIPYAKVLYGRGVYNFTNSVANVAYNMYTYGGGVDIQVRRSINVRGDYEFQNWAGFPLGTLHPSVITIGAAFHFHE
jgi:opacity protein-like surface antigen